MGLFLIHGLAASFLSVLCALIYNSIYRFCFYVDFSAIINPGTVIGACILSSLLIAAGDWLVSRWKDHLISGIYNLGILVLSFASALFVLWTQLPLNISFPELFPGLAIPMHLLPALSYFSMSPLFKTKF